MSAPIVRLSALTVLAIFLTASSAQAAADHFELQGLNTAAISPRGASSTSTSRRARRCST
jgi:hypothetical protein